MEEMMLQNIANEIIEKRQKYRESLESSRTTTTEHQEENRNPAKVDIVSQLFSQIDDETRKKLILAKKERREKAALKSSCGPALGIGYGGAVFYNQTQAMSKDFTRENIGSNRGTQGNQEIENVDSREKPSINFRELVLARLNKNNNNEDASVSRPSSSDEGDDSDAESFATAPESINDLEDEPQDPVPSRRKPARPSFYGLVLPESGDRWEGRRRLVLRFGSYQIGEPGILDWIDLEKSTSHVSGRRSLMFGDVLLYTAKGSGMIEEYILHKTEKPLATRKNFKNNMMDEVLIENVSIQEGLLKSDVLPFIQIHHLNYSPPDSPSFRAWISAQIVKGKLHLNLARFDYQTRV